MSKFQLATEKELKKIGKIPYSTFGGRYGGGIKLGVDLLDIVDVEAPDALYLLNKKYGSPNSNRIDDYKMSFEYVFKSNKFKGVFYRIYDYKGYMSSGFSIPENLEISKEKAEKMNKELSELIKEAFSPVPLYDYTLTIKGLK